MHKIIRQTTFAEVSEEYRAFEGKFKPKKTTDDCYTPDAVFDVVADWAAKRYGFDRSRIVRPFYPGGDYERMEYPDGCVVLDNPPFSILSKIWRFYLRRGVAFFLFAPGLTAFSCGSECNYVCCGYSIIYENGAKVNTSFITSMGDNLIETAPDLLQALKAAQEEKDKPPLPKYAYPPDVVTAARMNWLSVHGERFTVRRGSGLFVRKLDAMGSNGNGIFGGGFIVSERAVAERAAAERAAAERAAAERPAAERPAAEDVIQWQLSSREREIQKLLGRMEGERDAENKRME